MEGPFLSLIFLVCNPVGKTTLSTDEARRSSFWGISVRGEASTQCKVRAKRDSLARRENARLTVRVSDAGVASTHVLITQQETPERNTQNGQANECIFMRVYSFEYIYVVVHRAGSKESGSPTIALPRWHIE